jgi:hypothetical protein
MIAQAASEPHQPAVSHPRSELRGTSRRRWANQSAPFDTHRPKSRLIVPDRFENRANQHWSKISLDYAAAGQCKLYAVVGQRLRFPETVSCLLLSPVGRSIPKAFHHEPFPSPLSVPGDEGLPIQVLTR